MSNNNNVRNAVSQIAQQIENLARQVQDKLAQGKSAQGGDLIGVANELVRNSSTFTFTLGELFALEESGKKKVKTTVVSNPNNTTATATASTTSANAGRNYHNVRDSLGRFSRV